MNKGNLLSPRAKLNWANKQISTLDEIRNFVKKNVEPIPPYPEFTHGQIIRNDRIIPDDIKTSAGMIVQAQRDSLDYLAHALAVKNGAKRLRALNFPIADCEARFSDKGTMRKIAEISTFDQNIIVALKPYKGGTIFCMPSIGSAIRVSIAI